MFGKSRVRRAEQSTAVWLDDLAIVWDGEQTVTSDLLDLAGTPDLHGLEAAMGGADYRSVMDTGRDLALRRAAGESGALATFWRGVAEWFEQRGSGQATWTVVAATTSGEHLTGAMDAWLKEVDQLRPPASQGLTVDLLTIVGYPPIPARDGTVGIYEAARMVSYGSHLAEAMAAASRIASQEARAAEQPEAVAATVNRALFWSNVAVWIRTA